MEPKPITRLELQRRKAERDVYKVVEFIYQQTLVYAETHNRTSRIFEFTEFMESPRLLYTEITSNLDTILTKLRAIFPDSTVTFKKLNRLSKNNPGVKDAVVDCIVIDWS